MQFFRVVCLWLRHLRIRLRLWLVFQKVRFFHGRTKKLDAFLKLYEDRRPMSTFRQTLWQMRYECWVIEVTFWTDGKTLGMKMLKDIVWKHWAWRKHYLWQLRQEIKTYVSFWRGHLRCFFRPKNLKKWLHRRLKRMPVVCVTSNNGLTAVVLERDLVKAKRVFVGYRNELIVGGNYGDRFVPQRTMIFAKPTAQSFTLRKSVAEVATGTPAEMKELLRGCVVHGLPKSSFFVPYSSRRHLLEWQRETFPYVSLEKAYRLIWANRRKPVKTTATLQ